MQLNKKEKLTIKSASLFFILGQGYAKPDQK